MSDRLSELVARLPQPIPKAISFIHLVRSLGIAQGSRTHAAVIAQERFGADTTLRDIRAENLDDTAAVARLKPLVPALLKLSKCPDLVTDGGHLFGTQLADDDKRALIAFLKRL